MFLVHLKHPLGSFTSGSRFARGWTEGKPKVFRLVYDEISSGESDILILLLLDGGSRPNFQLLENIFLSQKGAASNLTALCFIHLHFFSVYIVFAEHAPAWPRIRVNHCNSWTKPMYTQRVYATATRAGVSCLISSGA